MTLQEHIEHCQELIARNPEVADYTAVFSSDNEGNEYHRAIHTLTIGYYQNNNWWPEEALRGKDCNSVCIN